MATADRDDVAMIDITVKEGWYIVTARSARWS
jgi:hypothetical protein